MNTYVFVVHLSRQYLNHPVFQLTGLKTNPKTRHHTLETVNTS